MMIPVPVHAVLDYVVPALLVIAVVAVDGGGLAQWAGLLAAGVFLAYSLLTRYELGLVRVIPFRTHLILDAGVGALLALSPWMLGFADRVWWPHLVFGLFAISAAVLTRVPARNQT